MSIEHLYPYFTDECKKNGSSYGPGNYNPILEDFGYDIVLKVDDNDYQGDSRILYQRGEEYGLLIFGWGSCSGCDALQACSTLEELQELYDSLERHIIWKSSKKEMLEYFQTRDWELQYSWHQEETRKFVKEAIELLSK